MAVGPTILNAFLDFSRNKKITYFCTVVLQNIYGAPLPPASSSPLLSLTLSILTGVFCRSATDEEVEGEVDLGFQDADTDLTIVHHHLLDKIQVEDPIRS